MKALLTINTGSSSVKFRLFGLSDSLPLLAGGKVTGIGNCPQWREINALGEVGPASPMEPTLDHDGAVDAILQWLDEHPDVSELAAVAHRIVHGGDRYTFPPVLTQTELSELAVLNPLAPQHQPHNLDGVRIFSRKRPGLPQYGCFDTAFHAGQETLFTRYALPEKLYAQGVRRYGFHGLSFAWVVHRLNSEYEHLARGRVVAAHLGNGASLCAIKAGRSIETTMGLTALDGLPMGTRCGSLDPGVILYLQRQLGYSLEDVEHLLYCESGLLGLSGISNDVQSLLASDAPEARFALDYFVLKTAQHIARMAVAIGGMDALVFTGGIGENSQEIRLAIVSLLALLQPFEVLVIPANEERQMALEVWNAFGESLLN
ncbi:MAG: acetate/propionate family kinase [Porticoccaceae bacterium]